MADYFRFHVQLSEIKPPVFRRFLLPTTATFHDLHMAIQAACGWENAHLYSFQDRKGKAIAGIPDDSGMGPSDPNAKKVKLTNWFSLTGNKSCAYVYDFGDHWQHDVAVETIEKHDTAFKRRLLDGARSFPREDSGGLPGYVDCVEVVATGEDPNELREWIDDWDPERFDLPKAKKRFDK